MINKNQQKLLLKIARQTLADAFSDSPSSRIIIPNEFKVTATTFVTLMIGQKLRGCIGSLEASEPLIDNIQHNALAAAFNDNRFPPISKTEFKSIKIEISILSSLIQINYRDVSDLLNQIQLNVDGLLIEYQGHSATFLPQVWEQLPAKEEFLAGLCEKAGLDGNFWQSGKLKVSKYQVQSFSEQSSG